MLTLENIVDDKVTLHDDNKKLYQAEEIRPNKQMSPTRIKIILERPHFFCYHKIYYCYYIIIPWKIL